MAQMGKEVHYGRVGVPEVGGALALWESGVAMG
jgi:hypothetical protein